MRARVVRIGNSQGSRIPKPLLERSGKGVLTDRDVFDLIS